MATLLLELKFTSLSSLCSLLLTSLDAHLSQALGNFKRRSIHIVAVFLGLLFSSLDDLVELADLVEGRSVGANSGEAGALVHAC